MPREEFMRMAIEKAREGLAQGQWPYGACLVDSPSGGERSSVVTALQVKELLASRIDIVGGFLRDEVIRLYGP